jgi:undecaprenyl-diphosphatase
MTLFESIVLGVVEGITEFLPISSTGHLILTSSLLGIEQTEFVKSFEIAIQFGAILSVVALYWRSFLDIQVLQRLAAAFVPTALVGLFLYDTIKTHLLGNEVVVVWALCLGGIALIVFEFLHREKEGIADGFHQITYVQCLLIGLFQSFAIVPGVSRSAATIVGGLSLGIQRKVVVEFSFLLAVPTMLAATGMDLLETSAAFTKNEWLALAVGFIVSFAVALVSIVWLLRFVRTHTFIPFGIYRVAIAALFFFLVLN